MKIKQKISNIVEQTTTRAIIAIFIITIAAASVVTYFESSQGEEFKTFWDSVWWVLVTISTVGYGDKVPVTPEGRITAVVIMLFGIALLSIITATVSSIFVTRKIREGKGLQEIKIKDHILICGWDEQAVQILKEFSQESSFKKSVVLINQLPEEDVADIISSYSALKTKFVRGDFTHENILARANAKHASSAVILPDSSAGSVKTGDERTLMAVLSLKTLNPKIKVYAHILDKENLAHLRKAQADEIIVRDAHTGFLLASHVMAPGIPQFFDQLFSDKSAYQIKRSPVPSDLVGKTYANLESKFQQEVSGILLGVGQMTEPFQIMDLMSDDYSYLDEFIMKKFQEAGRGTKSEEQVKILINPDKSTQLNENDFYLSIERESE